MQFVLKRDEVFKRGRIFFHAEHLAVIVHFKSNYRRLVLKVDRVEVAVVFTSTNNRILPCFVGCGAHRQRIQDLSLSVEGKLTENTPSIVRSGPGGHLPNSVLLNAQSVDLLNDCVSTTAYWRTPSPNHLGFRSNSQIRISPRLPEGG